MFKFAAAQHIEQFARGLLYMNTLKYFVGLGSDSPRKDPDEGTSHLWRADGAILQVDLDGRFVPVGEIREMRSLPDAFQTANVFCLRVPSSSPSVSLMFGDLHGQVIAPPCAEGVAQQFLNFLPLRLGQ
jgi:hypothetical protein